MVPVMGLMAWSTLLLSCQIWRWWLRWMPSILIKLCSWLWSCDFRATPPFLIGMNLILRVWRLAEPIVLPHFTRCLCQILREIKLEYLALLPLWLVIIPSHSNTVLIDLCLLSINTLLKMTQITISIPFLGLLAKLLVLLLHREWPSMSVGLSLWLLWLRE